MNPSRARSAGLPLVIAAAACLGCCAGPILAAIGVGSVTGGGLAVLGVGLVMAGLLAVVIAGAFLAIRRRRPHRAATTLVELIGKPR